jgi:hypothetical protein
MHKKKSMTVFFPRFEGGGGAGNLCGVCVCVESLVSEEGVGFLWTGDKVTKPICSD